MTWQPIETAPKDDKPVFLLSTTGATVAIWCKSNIDEYWAIQNGWQALVAGLEVQRCGVQIEIKNPTHWMPVPELVK